MCPMCGELGGAFGDGGWGLGPPTQNARLRQPRKPLHDLNGVSELLRAPQLGLGGVGRLQVAVAREPDLQRAGPEVAAAPRTPDPLSDSRRRHLTQSPRPSPASRHDTPISQSSRSGSGTRPGPHLRSFFGLGVGPQPPPRPRRGQDIPARSPQPRTHHAQAHVLRPGLRGARGQRQQQQQHQAPEHGAGAGAGAGAAASRGRRTGRPGRGCRGTRERAEVRTQGSGALVPRRQAGRRGGTGGRTLKNRDTGEARNLPDAATCQSEGAAPWPPTRLLSRDPPPGSVREGRGRAHEFLFPDPGSLAGDSPSPVRFCFLTAGAQGCPGVPIPEPRSGIGGRGFQAVGGGRATLRVRVRPRPWAAGHRAPLGGLRACQPRNAASDARARHGGGGGAGLEAQRLGDP